MKTLLGAAVALGALALAGPSAACPVWPDCPERQAHGHHVGAKPAAVASIRRHAPAASGYGISHGPGYGYPHGSPIAHAGYRSVDIQTRHYDSGWVEMPASDAPPFIEPHAAHLSDAQGYGRYTDTGWRPLGAVPFPLAQHCPHPGAIVCFPAAHAGPVTYVPPGAYDAGLTVGPEVFYGGSVGGVGYESGYGAGHGYGSGGGGTVVIQSRASASAYAQARASARARIAIRPRPSGRPPCCGGKPGH